MERKENQEYPDARKNHYTVRTRRDVKMMKTFISFSNRVRHPRVSANMFILGALLIALPIITDGIALAGVVICYGMGALLVLMALFRQYISVAMMRSDPQVKENEELVYLFGNSGIRVERDGTTENMGYYKNVYRIWEDEKNYYVGMNEDDLLILPKADFTQGDAKEFREFIVDKSGADYIWKPAGFLNVCKNTWLQIQWKLSRIGDEVGQNKNE